MRFTGIVVPYMKASIRRTGLSQGIVSDYHILPRNSFIHLYFVAVAMYYFSFTFALHFPQVYQS